MGILHNGHLSFLHSAGVMESEVVETSQDDFESLIHWRLLDKSLTDIPSYLLIRIRVHFLPDRHMNKDMLKQNKDVRKTSNTA